MTALSNRQVMNQNPNRAERPDIPTRPRRLHPQRHVRAVTHGRPKDIHHQRGVHRCNNHPTVRDDPHSPHLSYLRETSVYGRGKHGADVQVATPVNRQERTARDQEQSSPMHIAAPELDENHCHKRPPAKGEQLSPARPPGSSMQI